MMHFGTTALIRWRPTRVQAPAVIRVAIGGSSQGEVYHSQSGEWFSPTSRTPVVMPSTALDLSASCARDSVRRSGAVSRTQASYRNLQPSPYPARLHDPVWTRAHGREGPTSASSRMAPSPSRRSCGGGTRTPRRLVEISISVRYRLF